CLPPDGGLFVPAFVEDMRQYVLYMGPETGYPEMAATLASGLLQDELNPFAASRVAESAFNFEPELQRLDERFSLLTLYNGPTGVFKDFGIAFLAAVMEELIKNNGPVMIVSATRGETGASIANAFRSRHNITSVILYPSGVIQGLDPSSYVPNGGVVIPIQIEGSFDDCQRLVNKIIQDRPYAERYGITSANAINPGRLLPQAFYFLYAFIKVKKYLNGELLFSVPSGNFGNLIAGLYAWKFGMPVNGFIAAMNANNSCGDFIKGRQFTPRPVKATNSPALDVSRPSNYERLAAFYAEAPAVMRNMVFPASVDNNETLRAMERFWKRYGIIIDPHAAVAYAAAERVSSSFEPGSHVIIVATGHPAKKAATVMQATGQTVEIPRRLSLLREKALPLAVIKPSLEALETAIVSCV
ncbi:MAG: threonine synthase, partial [Spirochaetaceae bacterium]|nr:threonine synthase [Spirochaetaceae bacterium]